MKRYCLLMAAVTLAAASAPASAQSDRLQGRELPASIEGLKLEHSLTTTGISPLLDRNLAAAEGRQQVIVRLKGAPVARGGLKSDIQREQSEFLARCLEIPSARSIAQVHMILNAVFLEIDAFSLQPTGDFFGRSDRAHLVVGRSGRTDHPQGSRRSRLGRTVQPGRRMGGDRFRRWNRAIVASRRSGAAGRADRA